MDEDVANIASIHLDDHQYEAGILDPVGRRCITDRPDCYSYSRTHEPSGWDMEPTPVVPRPTIAAGIAQTDIACTLISWYRFRAILPSVVQTNHNSGASPRGRQTDGQRSYLKSPASRHPSPPSSVTQSRPRRSQLFWKLHHRIQNRLATINTWATPSAPTENALSSTYGEVPTVGLPGHNAVHATNRLQETGHHCTPAMRRNVVDRPRRVQSPVRCAWKLGAEERADILRCACDLDVADVGGNRGEVDEHDEE